MNVRPATEADEPILRKLWEEFEAEVPEPEGWVPDTWEKAWAGIREHISSGIVLLAEEDLPLAYVAVAAPVDGRAHVTDFYVRPRGRRRGMAKALLREAAARLGERGVRYVSLEVLTANAEARVVWERLGFREVVRTMVSELEPLAARLESDEKPPSFGSIHVQTDDERSVARAIDQFVPRLGRSRGTTITEARNGWIVVYDELCDRDRAAQRRLAGELSERLGAVVVAIALEEAAVVRFLLFERGRMVDEYLSVPSYYGPLPRVDELALAANPTLVARLTGADPARVRAVVRTASSPAELPPGPELLAQVAGVLGLTGAEHGFHQE
ncbi:MAG TPA: GNAT family N-acetyltransferase [Gaiellaceae bacterium]